MTADALAPFPSDPVGRAASRAKETRRPRIPGHDPGTRTAWIKTGRSIRCPARNSPAKEPEPVSSLIDKRTGASPSCREVSHEPLPFDAPSVWLMRCESGRFPSGAFMSAYPAMDHYEMIASLCKEVAAIAIMMVNRKIDRRALNSVRRGSSKGSLVVELRRADNCNAPTSGGIEPRLQ